MITAEVIDAADWQARAQELKRQGWWLADLCGLDTVGLRAAPGGRFHVVVHLLKHSRKERLRLHVAAAGEPPTVPSVTQLWPTADFMEREAFDMFGIHFEGHPNLTRLMMPEGWEGHPLRKDYGVGKVAIQFKDQPLLQIESPGQDPSSAAAGREVDELGQAAPVSGGAAATAKPDGSREQA